jgi:proteasome accessory factor B
MNRTERLAAIEQMLFRSPLGLRAVEIAEACDVDRRTIYRDLTLLGDIGVPIHQKDGRFFLDRENYTATIRLNLDEAAALFMAARSALRYNLHVLSALDKLGMALPEVLARHITLIRRLDAGSKSRSTTVLETLVRSWSEGRKVRLSVQSRDEAKPRSRDFLVYFIEPTSTGTICVTGFDEKSYRVRTFKLHRIRRVKLLSDLYRIPASFDPTRYLVSNLGFVGSEAGERIMVVMTFTGEAAMAVKDLSWNGGRLEKLDDKRYKLSLQVGDWRELMPWIRSWGAQIEVLEPQAMREACVQEAMQIVALYGVQVK